MFYFHSFTCSFPLFLALFFEETIFLPLHVLSYFVVDSLPIDTWAYIWAFYPVPLLYISVFVPVPYSFDDCSFVILSKSRKLDSSIFIFLFQYCFGYLGSLVFPHKFYFFNSAHFISGLKSLNFKNWCTKWQLNREEMGYKITETGEREREREINKNISGHCANNNNNNK